MLVCSFDHTRQKAFDRQVISRKIEVQRGGWYRDVREKVQ